MDLPLSVAGLLKSPKKTAGGKTYTGRFQCRDVQWTGSPNDLIATFTITAEELADAAANGLLWTDQDVQRGLKPDAVGSAPRELSLVNGYPDSNTYIFQAENADNIVEKLLHGEKLFLNSLIWNLRPNNFEAYWDEGESSLYLYSGKVYLPDSHHRHQAIIKAVSIWRSSPKEYPRFNGSKQFKIELYFLTREDEGNYFFDKNQRPKPTEKSKAYDLTTLDDLSLLAKRVIEHSSSLNKNVNRVTDRLTAKNPQVVTLSTLREMMKSFASSEDLDSSELEGMAAVAARFYDVLASVRPELGHQDIMQRRKIRDQLLVDSAVMMHGYAAVMKDYNVDLGKFGPAKAIELWKQKLQRLAANRQYTLGHWSGDLFAKQNPLWQRCGVVKPGRDGKRLTVLNTGGARAECGRILRQFLSVGGENTDLQFLTAR